MTPSQEFQNDIRMSWNAIMVLTSFDGNEYNAGTNNSNGYRDMNQNYRTPFILNRMWTIEDYIDTILSDFFRAQLLEPLKMATSRAHDYSWPTETRLYHDRSNIPNRSSLYAHAMAGELCGYKRAKTPSQPYKLSCGLSFFSMPKASPTWGPWRVRQRAADVLGRALSPAIWQNPGKFGKFPNFARLCKARNLLNRNRKLECGQIL